MVANRARDGPSNWVKQRGNLASPSTNLRLFDYKPAKRGNNTLVLIQLN